MTTVIYDDHVQLPTGRRRLRRFGHERLAVAGATCVLVVLLAAVFAPALAPYSPNANFPYINAGPSAAHWLGTDDIGRDLMSRLIFGARISLEAAAIIVFLALLIAVPVGLVAGYFSGRTDNAIMRVIDALFAFPPLILAITVAALLGRSLHNESIAIAVTFIPGLTRVVRGQVLSVREETYIEASRSVGAGPIRMIGRHVLPNVASPLIIQSAVLLGYALLAEAGLSFLGLGVQPPSASWGVMLQEAYQFVLSDPWATVVPGLAIALTVLSFNLVGDGLRDVLGRERA
ncbi:MAG TPA: ABC transporter permease [Acidimicrobiales bacterium]|nr:ABC transporter permease [Acidimicrobiales bacterium]